MNAGLQTVHVRINDAATGQPTPVRVHFCTPDGKYFAPLGRAAEFALGDHEDVGGNLLLGDKPYAYIDGTCEIRLPAGPILMEIHKGPEYTPRFLQTMLAPGKLTLRTQVERWTDLRQERWYSGDIRAHALSPHAALLEGAAEDLAVVNLLVKEHLIYSYLEADLVKGTAKVDCETIPINSAFSNILAFSGQQPVLETPGHLVVVNTHNKHRALGSLGLLNCHRLVYPLVLDDSEEWCDWAMADWADQCHRKGGLVVWTNMIRMEIELEDEEGFPFGEGLADLLLGKIDAVEVTPNSTQGCVENCWYRLLNAGCRVPLVAGSGKCCNRDLLGSLRTYARLQPDEKFSYRTWIEAVRAGRTFITNGPVVTFTADGHDPGAVLDLPSLDQPVQIALHARSALPFEQLELILNGKVILQVKAEGLPASASFEGSVTLPSGGWLAARCKGSHQLPAPPVVGWYQRVAAHTSPIYVQVGGRPPPVEADSWAFLLGILNKMLTWAERRVDSGNGHAPQHLVEILRSARKVLAERRG